MKTARMNFNSIKDTNWSELVHELKFESFKKDHPDLDEDQLGDKFYEEVISEKFHYGEYGSFHIIIDEDYNIIGGKIY